jgi:hypothetical protein
MFVPLLLTLSLAAQFVDLSRYSKMAATENVSASLKVQLGKPSAPLDTESLAPLISRMHGVDVHLAQFDRQYDVWVSERSFPRGVVLLQPPASGCRGVQYPAPVVDSLAAAGAAASSEQPMQQETNVPLFFLEYMVGTLAMDFVPASESPSPARGGKKKSDSALQQLGSSTCGHTQPLIQAPEWLLNGPEHPCFTMEPTLWVPSLR